MILFCLLRHDPFSLLLPSFCDGEEVHACRVLRDYEVDDDRDDDRDDGGDQDPIHDCHENLHHYRDVCLDHDACHDACHGDDHGRDDDRDGEEATLHTRWIRRIGEIIIMFMVNKVKSTIHFSFCQNLPW